MRIKRIYDQLKSEIILYTSNISIYIKYQLLTKGILFFFIIPLLYRLADMFIKASGQFVFSSGNYRELLSSLPIIVFLTLAVTVFLLATIIDINAFIAISASLKTSGKAIRLSSAITEGIKSVKSFFSPAGAFLLLYTMLIVPLVGVGLKTSLIKNLKIPNFISSVIYSTPLYSALYLLLLFILGVIGFFLLLSFHFMYLHHDNALQSIKNSIRTVWKNKLAIISNLLLLNGLLLLLTTGVLAAMYFTVEILAKVLAGHVIFSRFMMMFCLFTFAELIQLWFFLVWPLQIHMLTSRFYLAAESGKADKAGALSAVRAGKAEKPKGKISFRFLLIFFIMLNLIGGAVSAFFFDDLFRYRPAVDIIAHRGGGDLAAENTILGINAAVEAGAKWSEIDVMRSQDGVYVIHHDSNFKRLAGIAKAPSDMTWSEIQQLKIKDTFNPDRADGLVPDLDTVMETAKDRIGLLIELKGADADKKMADDVVEAIRSKNMKEEAIIISLDYKLVSYIEEKYPEIKTGYLYFFSLGDAAKINTDYLLMEESAISVKTIEKIHKEGKKAFVWTVNDPEIVGDLLDADVDGIITDRVMELKETMKNWDEKTDKDLILDEIKKLFTDHSFQ